MFCVELDVASDLLPDAADVTNIIIHKGTFGTETEIAHNWCVNYLNHVYLQQLISFGMSFPPHNVCMSPLGLPL